MNHLAADVLAYGGALGTGAGLYTLFSLIREHRRFNRAVKDALAAFRERFPDAVLVTDEMRQLTTPSALAAPYGGGPSDIADIYAVAAEKLTPPPLYITRNPKPPTGGSSVQPPPPLRVVHIPHGLKVRDLISLTTHPEDAPPVEQPRYYVRQFDGAWHVFDRYPGCDAFARHPVSIRTYSRKSAAVRGAERMNRK